MFDCPNTYGVDQGWVALVLKYHQAAVLEDQGTFVRWPETQILKNANLVSYLPDGYSLERHIFGLCTRNLALLEFSIAV